MAQQTDHIGDANKMVTMKLYTEEQLHKAFEDGYLYAEWEGQATEAQFERRFRDTVYSLKPISLPSDEEIEKETNSDVSIENDESFRDGAQWMRDKILNK